MLADSHVPYHSKPVRLEHYIIVNIIFLFFLLWSDEEEDDKIDNVTSCSIETVLTEYQRGTWVCYYEKCLSVRTRKQAKKKKKEKKTILDSCNGYAQRK